MQLADTLHVQGYQRVCVHHRQRAEGRHPLRYHMHPVEGAPEQDKFYLLSERSRRNFKAAQPSWNQIKSD